MWVQFAIAAALGACVLYLPGLIQLWRTALPRKYLVAFAPLLSVFELAAVGTVCGLAGIRVSGLVLLAVLAVLSIGIALVLFAAMRTASRHTWSKWDVINQGLYVVMGVAVTTLLFIRPLDGADSFAQMFDNAFHLNLMSSFVETGSFSVAQATQYPSDTLVPFGDLAFYPAAWHILTAAVADVLHVSLALAENAINVVLVACVFPLSMYTFVDRLFGDRARIHICAALCTLAFTAFPWGPLAYGPQYPNFAAFVLLPAAMSCFISLFTQQGGRAAYGVVFVFACCSLVCLQPNAIFTAAVILTPWCMLRMYRVVLEVKEKRSLALGAAGAFFVFVALIWVVCQHLPVFTDVVDYAWSTYATPFQAIMDYLDLGYRNTVAQVLLALIVFAGIVRVLNMRTHRWLLGAYGYFCLGYLLSGALEGGPFGTLITGFWYNDIDRIASGAVLVMIPLAACGLDGLAAAVAGALSGNRGRACSVPAYVCCAGAMMFAVYLPNFILAGQGDVVTSFGRRYERFVELATVHSLTDDEEAFLAECKQVVGDAVVANNPYDGSVYAYMTHGINLLNRHYFAQDDEAHDLINNRLDELSAAEDVRNAAQTEQVAYVVQLDAPGLTGDHSVYQPFGTDQTSVDGGWGGLMRINDTTPGFEVVLSSGDMRLYRVVA
ncbi:DUF6541 family protein [Enorma phocaeensis]|uniref:DUF6541 family protein n=1 Tax=Enorma phocaeensis TaxID=1871019 RepID=UPI00195C77E1|nr:DUF6541 family protein [Enorma phocaeensis]MBM6952117.1 hypothetical protein [Enorma phocaeensis]